MFEDSIFESIGTIHTRSSGWMFATFAFNTSVLLALAVIPLFNPEALPRMVSSILMEAPPVQTETAPPEPRPVRAAPASPSEMRDGVLRVPPRIPTTAWIPSAKEPPMLGDSVSLIGDGNNVTQTVGAMNGPGAHPVVRQEVAAKPHISSGVMTGMLIHKVVPAYPPLARAMHVVGTVVLEATISRKGEIENLRVVGGPQLLQQAAAGAVQQWRYRPYLLNGEPVDVETTINVEFTLQ